MSARMYNFIEDGAYARWGTRYEKMPREELLANVHAELSVGFEDLFGDEKHLKGRSRALLDVAQIRLRNLAAVLKELRAIEAAYSLKLVPRGVEGAA